MTLHASYEGNSINGMDTNILNSILLMLKPYQISIHALLAASTTKPLPSLFGDRIGVGPCTRVPLDETLFCQALH